MQIEGLTQVKDESLANRGGANECLKKILPDDATTRDHPTSSPPFGGKNHCFTLYLPMYRNWNKNLQNIAKQNLSRARENSKQEQ